MTEEEKVLENKSSQFFKIFFFFLVPLILAVSVGIYSKFDFPNVEQKCEHKIIVKVEKIQRPRYVIYDNSTTFYITALIDKVLQRLNLEKIELNGRTPEDLPIDSWDLYWTFAFQSPKIYLSKLSPNQKINHFPANVFMVSKIFLSTLTNSKYIPKAFRDNKSFQKYAAEHPEKKFVVKDRGNRGVKLMKPSEIKLDETNSVTEGNFAQEFIEKPLLWDGHKFYIAAYVAITSVDPLRLYYYDRHLHLRFVPKPYNISNPDDVESYVVDSNHLSFDKFEGVKKFMRRKFSTNDALEEFFKSKGKSFKEVQTKIENLIREIVLSKEEKIVKEIARIKSSKWNYFELFRFDMMLDEDFNVYLLEINMSPNMVANNPALKPLFENVLYNFFTLTGVATNYYKKFIDDFPDEYETMILADKTILAVNPEDCMSDKCGITCEEECEVCLPCLIGKRWKRELIQAHQEQMNSGYFKRLFPPSEEFLKSTDENFMNELSKSNKLLTKWYRGMCKKNFRFC